MLTAVLVVLSALYGFTGASEDCEIPVTQYCNLQEFNYDVPTTKDRLVTFCRNGKEALECIVSVLTKCKANEEDLSKLIHIQMNVDDLCDEHNILYQVVYENIECIGSALISVYFGCPEYVNKGIERVINESGIASELEEQSACSNSLFLLSCHITYTRQLCGILPSDALIEIFKLFHLPMQCKREIAAELPTIVETRELIKEEEMQLVSRFRKK